jgi:hypothetical protein
MTVNEVMATYRISQSLVYRLKKNGVLPFFKVSNQLRFWPEDVEAALLNQPVKEPTTAQRRAGLLSPEDIAFVSELAAVAPQLSEAKKDEIRAAFRGGGQP